MDKSVSNNNSNKLKAPSHVKKDRIEKAVDALLKWMKSQPKYQTPQLLEHDEFLYMVITLKKIPGKEKTNPYKIPIPNPVFPLDGSVEICLIINDGEKRVSRVSSEFAKAKVKEEGLPISKILKFSKLKTDYKPFEAKRKLCGSFDMFMADRSVIPLLPKYLGKTFYKKKKYPIPVDLSHKKWRRQIELSCSCALVYVRGGTCCVVKVGRVSQERDEIVENVGAVINGIVEVVPKKWKNVRSLHLKSLESVALPIYQAIPERPFKIEGVGSVDGLQVVAVEPEEKGEDDRDSEKEGEKKIFKKGRIHNVRYMDNMLEDSSNGLLGYTDQNEGCLGDEDRNVGLLGNGEQNDGLLGDKNQEEVDLPVSCEVTASKICSGENESDKGLLKSSKKNRSGKKVAGAKRRKDLSLEGKVSSLSDGDINEAVPYNDSTPVSQHRKRIKSIYSDVSVAVSVEALPKKRKTKDLEDRAVSNNVKVSATKGKTKHHQDGAVTVSAKKGKAKIVEDGVVTSNVKAPETKGNTKHCEDGAVTYSAKKGKTKYVEDGAVTKGNTKHCEDGAVTDSVKASAKKGKTKHFEDGAVTDSVKISAKKGKTKPLRG